MPKLLVCEDFALALPQGSEAPSTPLGERFAFAKWDKGERLRQFDLAPCLILSLNRIFKDASP